MAHLNCDIVRIYDAIMANSVSFLTSVLQPNNENIMDAELAIVFKYPGNRFQEDDEDDDDYDERTFRYRAVYRAVNNI